MWRRKASSVNQRKAWTVRSSLPYSSSALASGLPRSGLESGDQQRRGDVPEFQRSADPHEVFPVLVDDVNLGVVLEQRARQRPALVVAGRVGAPELLLGDPRHRH